MRRAAQSTVDALMYALRHGISALDNPNNLRRIGGLDDVQLRTCFKQLLHRTVAPSWSEPDVEVLANIWKNL